MAADAADHRPAAGGQEQVDRQPRALPAPLQGADPRGGQARGRRPRHPRHRARRGHPHPQARPVRAGVRPRPGRHARDGAPGQPGLRPRRPHRAAQGRRRRRQRQGPGQRPTARARTTSSSRSSKEEFMQVFFDDLALPHLVRTAAGRDARVEDATAPATAATARPNNLHVVRSMRGAHRPAHRASAASSRRELRELEERTGAMLQAPARPTPCADARSRELEARDRGAARARRRASPTSTRSTCATATACACRCPPARR